MNTITKERLRERASEKVKGLEFAVTQSAFADTRAELEEELELARIALASLEAEPIGAFHIVDQQVGGTSDYIKDGEWPIDNGVIEVYAAPPAPVAMKDHQIRDLVNELRDIAVEYYGTQQLRERIAKTVRAAMLQGAEPVSEYDELPLDYLQGHKDGLEWAAQMAEANHPQTGDWLYDDPIELARAIRKGPDMPTAQAGNSPVTPDCWIPVSERMPERDVDVQVYCADKKEQMVGYMERNETEGWFRFASLPNGGGVYCKPTHWMPLPAAPQQEAE